MKLKFVYGICPVFVFYEKELMPSRVMTDGNVMYIIGWAKSLGVVWIHIDHKDNPGVLAHELQHQKQMYRHPFTFVRNYQKDPLTKLQSEAQAYKAQLETYVDYREERLNAYAHLLANGYGLPVTQEAAKQAILNSDL